MYLAYECFKRAVEDAKGKFILNSGYRPAAYQDHLREIWDKRKELQRVRGTQRRQACASLKQQVEAEFAYHTLLPTQRPAVGGKHPQGLAMDVNVKPAVTGLSTAKMVELADGCGLYRPYPTNDPVHFELKP